MAAVVPEVQIALDVAPPAQRRLRTRLHALVALSPAGLEEDDPARPLVASALRLRDEIARLASSASLPRRSFRDELRMRTLRGVAAQWQRDVAAESRVWAEDSVRLLERIARSPECELAASSLVVLEEARELLAAMLADGLVPAGAAGSVLLEEMDSQAKNARDLVAQVRAVSRRPPGGPDADAWARDVNRFRYHLARFLSLGAALDGWAREHCQVREEDDGAAWSAKMLEGKRAELAVVEDMLGRTIRMAEEKVDAKVEHAERRLERELDGLDERLRTIREVKIDVHPKLRTQLNALQPLLDGSTFGRWPQARHWSLNAELTRLVCRRPGRSVVDSFVPVGHVTGVSDHRDGIRVTVRDRVIVLWTDDRSVWSSWLQGLQSLVLARSELAEYRHSLKRVVNSRKNL